MRRQVGSSQYWQVYGIGGELVAEYQWNGTTATLQKEYGSGGEASVVAEGSTVRWLVVDHLGTPRIITDQTGSLSGITRHDYLPFGEDNFAGSVRAGNGYQDEGVRQQFTGYERDDESGLDFAEARYHAAKLGRFTSPDPLLSSAGLVEPQSWNRYSYVGNRPLIVTDPSGLKWFFNKKTNKYGWCDCQILNQQAIAEGWTEIAGLSGGALIYESADGRLIILEANSPHWRNLTAEFLAQARLRNIAEAKENAEKWANAILLDFIAKSIDGAAAVLSGGGSVALKVVVKEVAQNLVEDYIATQLEEGTFSIFDWSDYPDGAVKPSGPFRYFVMKLLPFLARYF